MSTSKNGALLRHILELQDDGIQVCLLQDALLQTNQDGLLYRVLATDMPKKENTLITREDISRNICFLKQELEPLRFGTMLEDNDHKLKEILLAKQSRRQRCEVFLDHLLSCCGSEMESFSSELQRLQLTYITDYLVSSRHQGYAGNRITRDDISKNMSFLDDMIDPLKLRHLLSGNENDRSRTALATVLSTRKKRRCKVFLEVLMESEDNIFNNFVTYLEEEKQTAVKYLLNARETEEFKARANIESLLDVYPGIVAEIEPRRLKEIFLEKQVFSQEDFKMICSKPSRKGRAVALMESVLNGPSSRAQCLIEALDSTGYETLANEIKHCQEKCAPCPRLYRCELGSHNCIVFEGKVNMKFEDNSEYKCPSASSKIFVTELSASGSPFADSGCESSNVNTPGSGKASGCTRPSSGYLTGSECDTPHTSSAIQNQTSTDSNEKKTTISLRKFIVKYFAFLKAEIDPTRLIDTLCIDGVISNDIVEKIKSEKLRAGKCDLLFKSISKATYNNDDSKILEKVKFAFESAGYGHVLKTLEDETEFETIQSDESHLPKDVKQVLSSTPFWEDELEPLQVIDVLVSKNICSLEEHENIRNAETRKLRSALLKEKFCSLKEKERDVFFSISYAKYPRLSEDFKVEARKKTNGRYKMIVTHRQDDQLFYEQHRWASGEKAHDADTVVTLKFASHGKEQAFISPLDFDERLEDVVLENGFEILTNSSSFNKIELKSLSSLSQIDFLQKCCDSVEFLEEWLPLIFTEKDVERLRLNCIDELLIKIKVNILDSQKVACQCSLTIEKIVQQYSYLERNLESADEIIETFSRFEGFNKDMKLFFASLLDRSHLTRKDCFLRYLLDYPCTRIQFCLLEKEMRKKNLQLLKHVAEVQKSETEHLLTVRQIRSNKTFLCNELEPRYFIEMLSGLAGDENILEKIMSNAPRQKRCGKLIELVIYRKLVPRFMQELERCNKSHLVEFITGHRKNHGQTDIKYSLIKHYERIIDEIEPMLMRNVFVERIGPRAYENIQTLPRRRQRAKSLMRYILKGNGNENIGKTFLDALEIAGYVHLLESLTTDIESHKECPKLYQSLNGDHEEFVINSIFKLEFLDNKGKDKQKRFKEESNMQEEAKLKRQRTCEWVQLHYQ